MTNDQISAGVAKFISNPITAVHKLYSLWRGFDNSRNFAITAGPAAQPRPPNDLESYFETVKSGPGIMKWMHYFEIYDRHLSKFRQKPTTLCEIGVYGGGGLRMWREYLGPRCRLYGVDIEEACKVHEGDGVEIVIGDQSDRGFWKDFKRRVPEIDIIVDDGGHEFNQQVATLEEMLPHLRPGGVYICEDVHGTSNDFALYISGLSWNLNTADIHEDPNDDNRRLATQTSAFQSAVHSVHLYPFVVIIERTDAPVAELAMSKRGTQWPPSL